jgi:hypothetical protein
MRRSARLLPTASGAVPRYVFCVIYGAGAMHDFAGTRAAGR